MKIPDLSNLSNEDLKKTLQEMKEDNTFYRENGMVRKIAQDLELEPFMAVFVIHQEAAKRWLENQTPICEQIPEQWFKDLKK